MILLGVAQTEPAGPSAWTSPVSGMHRKLACGQQRFKRALLMAVICVQPNCAGGAALCGYLTQMMITTGLKRIPATLGTATSYLTVVWGMVLGYFVFHEVPTLMSLLGAAMICGSALALSIVEGRPAPSQPSDGGAYASQGSGLQRMKQGLLGLCRRAASWGKREQGWMSLRQDEQMQETEMMLAPGR